MSINTDEPMSNEEVKLYAERFEAKRRYEMELAIETRAHERMFDPFIPMSIPVMPWWSKGTDKKPRGWSCW